MKNIFYRLLLLPLLLVAWGAQAQAPAWLNAYGIPYTSGSVQGVATNSAGDIYVTGYFSGTLTLGATPTLTSAGGNDVFVAKWSASTNNWAWSVRGGGTGGNADDDQGNGIAVYGGNVYVTGYINSGGGATFGSAATTYAGAGGQDIFVARLVDGGASVSSINVVTGGGTSGDQGRAIAVSGDGNSVYVTGYVNNNTAVVSGTSLTTAYGSFDVFVAKYTSTLGNGNAVRAGGSGIDRANGIAVNGTNVYVTGSYRSASATFGSSTLTNSDASGGSYDVFVTRLTDTGTLALATAVSAGGGSGTTGTDDGFGIAASTSAVYVTGSFTGSALNFSGGPSLANGAGGTSSDSFLAKLDLTTLAASAATKGGTTSATNNNGFESGLGVAVSGTTVYMAGNFSGTADFGTTLTAANFDAFVAKYTDAGSSFTALGAIAGGGSGGDAATGIALSGTQVVVGGNLDPSQTNNTFGSNAVASGNGGFLARVGQAPTSVTSIVPASTNPTNAASVQFTVTFAASVTGLTINNFTTANGGGVTGSSVTSVTPVSGTVYTVTVNTGSGSGTLGLTLANDTGLTPGISNEPFTGTPLYSIDKTAPVPTITSGTAANGGTSSSATFTYTVTFSEMVNNFIQNDVTVTNGNITGFSNSGNVYTVTVAPIANGAVNVSVAAGVAQDAVGNTNVASTPNPYSITYAAPTATVTSISKLAPTAAQSSTGTATAQVQFTVTFSAAVSGVGTGNFSLTQTTSGATITGVSPTTGSSATYTVTVNTGSGNGTLQLNVANATGITPSVTNTPYNGTGAVYTITKSFAAAPALRIQAGGSASGNGDVTAFVDLVQVLQSGTSTAVANALQNGSFETNNVDPNSFRKATDATPVSATPWSFTGLSGVSRNGSAFGSMAAGSSGDAVALIQSAGDNNAGISQNLAVPTGSYQISFQAIQRNYTSLDQRLNVFANNVFVGTFQPNNSPSYGTFTSATFAVTAPALTATVSTTSASPTSTSPIPFSVSFSQSVGTTFTASDVSVTNGTVTSGSLSGSGAGPYTFTVTPSGSTVTVSLAANVANDANNTGNSASNSVSVQYVPAITLSPSSPLPNGTVGVAYSQSFTASGGTAPYSYAITAGALPAGITLASNGSLSGTPTAGGTFNFTVTATDASAAPGPYSGSQVYTLTINAPTIALNPPSPLPNGTVGVAYSQSFRASGGTASYSYAITDGALPAGMTLASDGSFSGRPTAGGSFTFTVTATDASTGTGPYRGSRSYSLTINAAIISLSPPSPLPNGTVGVAYSQNFTASGGTAPYSYAITGGALPAGLSLASNGALTGTPTGGGSVTFFVTATDASTGNGPYSGTRNYSLTINAATITVAPASLPDGTQNTAYSQNLAASGGTAPYRFSITSGALPAGLTLSSAGVISGTPIQNGTFPFTVTATDASTGTGPYTGSRNYSLFVAAPAVTSVGWTGNTSTSWFEPSNWNPNQVPDATIDATIPGAPSGNRFPVIGTGTAFARNLTLNSGATIVQTGGTLDVRGDLTNNGTFQPTGGTVVLGNTTLSNILGSSNTRFWNLTVGASGAQQSTSASTSVQRVLTLNGNFAINGNPFTLESNAGGTAMVVNNGSAVVTGSLTVQRYIDPSTNAGLGYRHFASPISSATVASLATASFSPVVNPDYNVSTTPAKVRPFPTVYGYDQARLATASNNLSAFDKGWVSPDNTAAPLTVGRGYTVNLTANQTFALTGAPNNAAQPISLTLSRNAVGTPNAGDAGFQLVGNPFPSPLDFSLIAATDRVNLDPAAYVYTSNGQFTGSYRTILNGVGGSSILPLGQGFFMHVANDATSAQLNFRNSQRVTSYSNVAYQRTGETRPLVQLSLQGTGSSLADAAYVYFENGATDGYESAFDALKLPNPTGLNLSASLADKQLAIDGHAPLGTSQRVVPLAVGVPAPGSYSLTAAQLLNLATTPVYLRDVQTGAVVDLQQQPTYQFTVSNAAALVTGRFELVFSPQQPLATAPAALAQQVALYPNPAKTTAFLELPASLGRQAVTATLVDALGRVVRTVNLPAQGAVAHPLDLHELATGVYALRLTTSAGTIVKRLTVE